MDVAYQLKLAALAGLVCAFGFFSCSESALFSLGLYRVRRLRSLSLSGYNAAQKLLNEPTRLISTLLTGSELVNAGISVVGSSLIYQYFRGVVPEKYLPFMAVAAVLPFVLVFGEIIPKTIGLRHPEAVGARVAVPLYWFSRIVAPVRDLLARLSDAVLHLTGHSTEHSRELSEAVFRTMVDAGADEGVLDPLEQRLIHNVFNLDDVKVSRIMTPASQVSVLQADMTVAEAFDRMQNDRYSRFPVVTSDGKRAVGTLYAKDLIGLESIDRSASLEPYVRPPILVSANTTAMDLFSRFRRQRTHFGVIYDEQSGDMLGVVTLEDVLEEIFGDIQDELDIEEVSPSAL